MALPDPVPAPRKRQGSCSPLHSCIPIPDPKILGVGFASHPRPALLAAERVLQKLGQQRPILSSGLLFQEL